MSNTAPTDDSGRPVALTSKPSGSVDDWNGMVSDLGVWFETVADSAAHQAAMPVVLRRTTLRRSA